MTKKRSSAVWWPIVWLVLFVLLVAGMVVVQHPAFGAKPKGARQELMQRSPDFRKGVVWNRQPTPMSVEDKAVRRRTMRAFFLGRRALRIPTVPLPVVRTALDSLPLSRDAYVWFGHSSFLVQLEGKRLLFDPIFTYRFPSGVVLKPFPMEYRYGVEDMPALDYIFITHDHFDHLDYGTIRALDACEPMYVCPLGVGAHLERWGIPAERIVELAWDESYTLAGGSIKVTCRTARHFSGRFLNDRDATFFASYVVETPQKRLFFSGDGGYGDHFKAIREAHGDFDYAFLECGQYNVAWPYIHSQPQQVPQIAEDLCAKRFVPIHNSKFSLALHPWHEPLDSVWAESARRGLPLLTPRIGEVLWLDGRDTVFAPWWRAVVARERAQRSWGKVK